MFHFLQPNHFAFDSLLYDGNTGMMVLIQITIDQSHALHYEPLIGFIEQDLKWSLKYYEKYFRFFGQLNTDLVSTFVFQKTFLLKYMAISIELSMKFIRIM